MSKKGGLNRGLEALFQENSTINNEESNDQATKELDIEEIVANPFQPRMAFDEIKLQELADSIEKYGIVEPIVVREAGRKFQIVAGERRYRAAKLAGLTKVPVVVKELDDSKMIELALIENIQRHDLNPIEEAKGIRRLMTEFNLTQEEASQKVGRSRVAVTNILRLLNLSENVQQYIIDGILSMGQAKQLLGLNEEQQKEVALAIIDNGWSSRITEEVVRRLKEGKEVKGVRFIIESNKEDKKEAKKIEQDMFCKDFQDRLVELLGTKVKVLPKPRAKGKMGGTIQIEYYSSEDLERIYEILNNKPEEDDGVEQVRRLNV